MSGAEVIKKDCGGDHAPRTVKEEIGVSVIGIGHIRCLAPFGCNDHRSRLQAGLGQTHLASRGLSKRFVPIHARFVLSIGAGPNASWDITVAHTGWYRNKLPRTLRNCGEPVHAVAVDKYLHNTEATL
jgi:hypothetical protein